MGHIGLTPQSIHAFGGFKVQGKTLDGAREIVDDAVALAEAGVFAIVLECVPDAVARMVTDAVAVPTIGIGAGRHCDGQVLVYHDILGFEDRRAATLRAALRPNARRRDDGDRRASRPTCATAASRRARRRTTPPTASTDALGLYGLRRRRRRPSTPDVATRRADARPRRRAVWAVVGFGLAFLGVVAWFLVASAALDDGADDGPQRGVACESSAPATPSRRSPGSPRPASRSAATASTLVVADDARRAGRGPARPRGDRALRRHALRLRRADDHDRSRCRASPRRSTSAFYDGAGRPVSRTSMEPCAKAESDCPAYRADGAFVFAVETRPGGLAVGRLRCREMPVNHPLDGCHRPAVRSVPIGPLERSLVASTVRSSPQCAGDTTCTPAPAAGRSARSSRRRAVARPPDRHQPARRRSEGGTGPCGRTRSWSSSTRSWTRRRSGPRSPATPS